MDDCERSCPCKATNPRDAVSASAVLIGLNQDKAAGLIAILSTHGWKLTKETKNA